MQKMRSECKVRHTPENKLEFYSSPSEPIQIIFGLICKWRMPMQVNVQQPKRHPEVLAARVQLLFHDGAPQQLLFTHSNRSITSGCFWINQLLCLIKLL